MNGSDAMEEHTEWHSIRPWRPTLTLTVREITSVSVTFILSSLFTGTDSSNQEPFLNLSSSEEEDQDPSISDGGSQIISDVLSKGLSVKVNGIPWQRVLMKIDEEADDAVIILFGLMPARQYDVELGILPGERSVRGHITTDAEIVPDTSPAEPSHEEPAASTSPLSTSISNSVSPQLSASSSLDGDGTSPLRAGHSPSAHLTLEDRRAQLTHTLSILNAEHASLTSSLKSARRESQKADAALRSEIDALRRASDRHAAGEHRARQKVLALQEAAKQTHAAAAELERLIADIESAQPGLEARRARVEGEWAEVKAESERARARKEEAGAGEKRRAEGLQTELAGLVNRLDRLNGRREKLEGEGGLVEELEEKLRRLEEERERIEGDPYGYEGDGVYAKGEYELPPGQDSRPRAHPAQHQPLHPAPHLVHPRKRHSHPHYAGQHHAAFPSLKPAGVGKPEPIQRPPHSARLSLPGHLSAGPGVIHLHSHSLSLSQSQRPGSARFASHSPGSGSGSGSSSGSSSTHSATPVPGLSPHPSASGSSLSSRAPPFEPSGLSSRITAAGTKSDLNPGSSPFSPRSAVVQAVAMQAASAGGGKGNVTPP